MTIARKRASEHRHAIAILWFWIGAHGDYDRLLMK